MGAVLDRRVALKLAAGLPADKPVLDKRKTTTVR